MARWTPEQLSVWRNLFDHPGWSLYRAHIKDKKEKTLQFFGSDRSLSHGELLQLQERVRTLDGVFLDLEKLVELEVKKLNEEGGANA